MSRLGKVGIGVGLLFAIWGLLAFSGGAEAFGMFLLSFCLLAIIILMLLSPILLNQMAWWLVAVVYRYAQVHSLKTALRTARADFADVAWGSAGVVVGLFGLVWSYILAKCGFNGLSIRLMIMAVCVMIWGTRLAVHLLRRVLKRSTEDERYQKLRTTWHGHEAWRLIADVYLSQGLLLFLLFTPILFTGITTILTLSRELCNGYFAHAVTWLDLIGGIGWLSGFVCETVADWQLDSFYKNPANERKIMDCGLWAYSRHPNYFGELLQWWSIALFGCVVSWQVARVVDAFPGPYLGFLGIMSPLFLTYMITKVTGIPLVEKQLAHNPAYREYQRRVSMLVPWIPRQ